MQSNEHNDSAKTEMCEGEGLTDSMSLTLELELLCRAYSKDLTFSSWILAFYRAAFLECRADFVPFQHSEMKERFFALHSGSAEVRTIPVSYKTILDRLSCWYAAVGKETNRIKLSGEIDSDFTGAEIKECIANLHDVFGKNARHTSAASGSLQSKDNETSDQEPYWRALDNKTDKKPSGRLLDLAAKFDFDPVKNSDTSDDVEVRIGADDFQFIQEKMQDEFYVSPKDVIHDALFYMREQQRRDQKALEERNAKNPPDPSVAEFFEKAKADGTLGTPEFNREFNRRFCDSDDLQKKLSDGAELEY